MNLIFNPTLFQMLFWWVLVFEMTLFLVPPLKGNTGLNPTREHVFFIKSLEWVDVTHAV